MASNTLNAQTGITAKMIEEINKDTGGLGIFTVNVTNDRDRIVKIQVSVSAYTTEYGTISSASEFHTIGAHKTVPIPVVKPNIADYIKDSQKNKNVTLSRSVLVSIFAQGGEGEIFKDRFSAKFVEGTLIVDVPGFNFTVAPKQTLQQKIEARHRQARSSKDT